MSLIVTEQATTPQLNLPQKEHKNSLFNPRKRCTKAEQQLKLRERVIKTQSQESRYYMST